MYQPPSIHNLTRIPQNTHHGTCAFSATQHRDNRNTRIAYYMHITYTFSLLSSLKMGIEMGRLRIQRVDQWYSDWPRAGRSGIESRWERDFPPAQTDPAAHAVSCKMGTGSSPGVKCGRGVLLTTHSLLVPRSWKSRVIPLPTLWATPAL